MSFSKPTSLGILACPGGTVFAQKVIANLKTIYQRRFKQKAAFIAKLYNKSLEETYRHLNYVDDLASHRVIPVGDAGEYRQPTFNIPAKFTRFPNGELKTEILRSVRDLDVFIIQDVANDTPIQLGDEEHVLSVNDHILNLLVTTDAVKQAGARRITLVLPTYPYSRQHKKKGRESLTVSLLSRVIENLDVARIITLDIHSKEVEHSFGSLALENLHASYQILRTVQTLINLTKEDLVVVAPDIGGIDRNKFYADSLLRPLALLRKERDYNSFSRTATESNIISARLLGDVKGKTVFMADDILGTGGTLIKAMRLVREMGAQTVIACISLPLFTGNAVESFDKAHKMGDFDFLVGTNAVCLPQKILERPWYHSVDVSNLFARSISRVHHNRSLSPLLDNRMIIEQMFNRMPKNSSEDTSSK